MYVADGQTSQWINKYGWRELADGYVFVCVQDENIKTKNITEKISFDSKYHENNSESLVLIKVDTNLRLQPSPALTMIIVIKTVLPLFRENSAD